MGIVIKIKRPGREATLSPSSSAEVKNESYGSTNAVCTAVARTRTINEIIGMVRAHSMHEKINEHLQFVLIKPSL
jgi:hypothetical protein